MNIFNDFEVLDLINLDEMMWEGEETPSSALVVQNAVIGVTVSSIALLQAHTLEVANAAIALTAENLDLIEKIGVANASISVTADGDLLLTQKHVLSVNNAVVGVVVSSIALTGKQTLEVDDAAISVTPGSILLFQKHLLVSQNAVLTLTSTVPELAERWPIHSVHELTALIRAALNDSVLTDAEILRAINDGYMDVSWKGLCKEVENMKLTSEGNRAVTFVGHRVNFVHWNNEADRFWVSCEASIASGSLYYPVPDAPTFSLTSGFAYIDELFPISLSITGSGTIHYTIDGSTPTEDSPVYEEAITITGISGDPGSSFVVRAIVFTYVASEVATWTAVKMGDFLYALREYWTYDYPAITGTIDSGALIEIIAEKPGYAEQGNLLGGEIDSGTYTEIVSEWSVISNDPAVLSGGIINQGKYWDPVVEPEPPWD